MSLGIGTAQRRTCATVFAAVAHVRPAGAN